MTVQRNVNLVMFLNKNEIFNVVLNQFYIVWYLVQFYLPGGRSWRKIWV